MNHLHLLFTKNALQYQVSHNKTVLEENAFVNHSEASIDISKALDMALGKEISSISVVSAINHFAVMPKDFQEHEMGHQLIQYNAEIEKENEELMLSVNPKFNIQFYYTLPVDFYQQIKQRNLPTTFNFSGGEFLDRISVKSEKEIHILLYENQCEFVAIENNKVLLYNNLDITSEVDFLYFIMFTVNKINFGLDETQFLVYGEITENETFISELKKFVQHLEIVFNNEPKRHFILT